MYTEYTVLKTILYWGPPFLYNSSYPPGEVCRREEKTEYVFIFKLYYFEFWRKSLLGKKMDAGEWDDKKGTHILNLTTILNLQK